MKRYTLVVEVEDHAAEAFGREIERGLGEDGNLEIDGYAYYDRLISVVGGQAPPACPNHKEVQHRDRKPPWCNKCGWSHGQAAVPARPLGFPRD